MAKFMIDRTELPYDAMVADPSWLGIIDEDEFDEDENEKTDKNVNR